MKRVSRVLWGLVLVAVGVIWGLNALHITNIDLFFKGWWTLFLIVPCTIGLFTDQHKTGNIVGLVLGVLLLLACRGLFSFDWILKLFVPFIIVVIGLRLIFRGAFDKEAKQIAEKLYARQGEIPSYCATFSGQNVNFAGQEFTGAELTAVFGGIKCDLRQAQIRPDAVIKVSAIFGGIDILLPPQVQVKTNVTGIFGGADNKHQPAETADTTLYVTGSCIFGGADIK